VGTQVHRQLSIPGLSP